MSSCQAEMGILIKDRSLKVCKVAKRDEGASVTRELRGARRRRAIISEKVAATHTYTRTE